MNNTNFVVFVQGTDSVSIDLREMEQRIAASSSSVKRSVPEDPQV